jgi:hypothetical protein
MHNAKFLHPCHILPSVLASQHEDIHVLLYSSLLFTRKSARALHWVPKYSNTSTYVLILILLRNVGHVLSYL